VKEIAMLIVLAETQFDPARTDLLEPDLMRVRELWKDEQALKDHFATPHMAAFLKGLRELKPAIVIVKCYELGPERKMPGMSS
jgi:quinol monooxygenase YgiN